MEAQTLDYMVLITSIIDFLSTIVLALLGGYCTIRCCGKCFEISHQEHTSENQQTQTAPTSPQRFSRNSPNGNQELTEVVSDVFILGKNKSDPN
jgi:hypothetical protein